MKNFAVHNFKKIIVSLILVAFGFSLQSFIGVRIEKRHYRKGYYVHIWHNPKTKPVHTVTEKVVVKQAQLRKKSSVGQAVKKQVNEEKIISAPQPVAQQKEDAPSSDDGDRGRNIAPVSRAIPNN